MKRAIRKSRKAPARETLTEAYEVWAFLDESEEPLQIPEPGSEVRHAEPLAFERIKKTPHRHGEQRIIADDCQFGDNDLCSVDA